MEIPDLATAIVETAEKLQEALAEIAGVVDTVAAAVGAVQRTQERLVNIEGNKFTKEMSMPMYSAPLAKQIHRQFESSRTQTIIVSPNLYSAIVNCSILGIGGKDIEELIFELVQSPTSQPLTSLFETIFDGNYEEKAQAIISDPTPMSVIPKGLRAKSDKKTWESRLQLLIQATAQKFNFTTIVFPPVSPDHVDC
jgi:hypothetical protein